MMPRYLRVITDSQSHKESLMEDSIDTEEGVTYFSLYNCETNQYDLCCYGADGKVKIVKRGYKKHT